MPIEDLYEQHPENYDGWTGETESRTTEKEGYLHKFAKQFEDWGFQLKGIGDKLVGKQPSKETYDNATKEIIDKEQAR